MSRAEDLRSSDPAQRVRALADLSGGGAPAGGEVEALLECLGDGRKLVQRRAAEACAALMHHRDVVTRVRTALVSPEARLRWGAAYALALAGEYSDDSMRVLAEVLGCDDGDLRWAALDLFKRHAAAATEAVVPRLIELATAGNGPQRKMALYGLRDLQVVDPAAAQAAVAALQAGEPDVRLAGIATLGRLAIDRSDAAAALLLLLDDPTPQIERAAAAALGSLGIASAEVISGLERVRGGTDDALRRAAERSLQMLGTKAG